MAGMVSEDLKRRIRESTNLVDLVESAVGKLTRAGRNLKACCPFHNEKTPSFNVNADGQYFKCFGCGKSGDVFTFVMLHERVDFPEALEILADRAGIRVEVDPQAAIVHRKETDWKSYLFRLNDVAAKFFREQLHSDAGKPARDYLKKRGLSDAICERFRIGYAPSGGGGSGGGSPLVDRLRSLNAPLQAIVQAGLATQRDNGSVRDFFFDRLMFPITDIQSRVIAFGGRILGIGEPKYLNTRETPLFSKARTTYGIDLAKDEIVKTRKAILVEGYTDVMMCHQFGVTHVVACLGTAITADHVRQLRRVADELLLMTDSDAAGAKASERSISVLFAEEMPAKVVRLPSEDKDPCDFLLAHGSEAFLEAFKIPTDLFEYKFESIRKVHDLRSPLGLKSAAEELMRLISTIPNTLLKNQYRYEVLKRLNIDERDLHYETRSSRANTTHSGPESGHGLGVGLGGADGSSGNVAAQNLALEADLFKNPENELAAAERELLRFLFHEPAWLEQSLSHVDLNALQGKAENAIGRALLQALGEGKLPPDINNIPENGVGSIVAREVLQRLRDADTGQDAASPSLALAPLAAVQSVCVSLAETPPITGKLEPELRFEMLLKPVLVTNIQYRLEEATRYWTHAKLSKDVNLEESSYTKMVLLRKQLTQFRAMSTKKGS
jgi:DNA primase